MITATIQSYPVTLTLKVEDPLPFFEYGCATHTP
jgi:hypothetical protein